MAEAVSRQDARKIPFGLLNGQMVHVNDVLPGRQCGCVCAECGKPLVASNRMPRVVAKYFRHDAGAECPGGYESAIHRAAKEVLMRRQEVKLPGKQEWTHVFASDGQDIELLVEVKGRTVKADRAWEELWQDGMRPDVVFEVGGRMLYLEIKVAHAVDLVKQGLIRARNVAALEIDLSDLTPDDLCDMETFERLVCELASRHEWLYFPKFEERLAAAKKELEQLLVAYEQKLAKREQARRAKEAIENERLRKEALEQQRMAREKAELLDERRAPLRRQHAAVLACIEGFQDRSLINEMDRRRQDTIQYQPRQGQFAHDKAFLFDRTEGYWIFEARHQDWQAYVLDLLIDPDAKRKTASTKDIARQVSARFGVVPWVRKVNSLETARKFSPDSDDGIVLLEEETGVIPDPYKAVSRYFDHLKALGILKKERGGIVEIDRLSQLRGIRGLERP